MMRRICLWMIVLATVAWYHPIRAEEESTLPQGLRRTYVVDVVQRFGDAVVYVSGPASTGHERKVEDFFNVKDAKTDAVTLGTGFLVDPSGYVLTNAHSVQTILTPRVLVSNVGELPAEVVYVMPEQDLALLKVAADRPLPWVRLARGGDILIGEPVIVIGNPYGLRATCTVGVLSAVGRVTKPSGLGGVVLRDMIQTDASINAGSSGGPWFNAAGEAMGITVSRKDDSDNIAFATPVAAIRQALPTMLDLERRFGLTAGCTVSADGPCKVESVAADGPAAQAGVTVGDVITQVGDSVLTDGLQWTFLLATHHTGDVLPLKATRGDATTDLSLTLGQCSQPDGAALLNTRLGVSGEAIPEDKAKELGMRLPRGVLLSEVDKSYYEGVETPPEPGDVLARIEWIRPRDLSEVGRLLDRIPADQPIHAVILRVRDGVSSRIDLQMAPRPKPTP